MERMKIGMVPVRRQDFSEQEAQGEYKRLLAAIEHFDAEWVGIEDIVPGGVSGNAADVQKIVKKFKDAGVQGLFFPHMDFGNEAVVGKTAAAFDLPILVWGNSAGEIANGILVRYTQCGMFATGKILNDYQREFDYIVACPPGSARFERGIDNFIRVCCVMRAFHSMKVLQVSTRPELFWSVKCNEQELLERFGIEVTPLTLSDMVRDVRELLAKADDSVQSELKRITENLDARNIAEEQLKRVVALKMVIESYFSEYGASAAAVQCWSSLQSELGIMPCSAFGLLCDEFLPVACETDIKGAIGSVMLQAAALDKTPVFFSDVTIQHPENQNANLLWHCGNFPPSLARKGQQLRMNNHPLQEPNPGAVGEWELREGDITINRFDSQNGDYSMLLGCLHTVDGPKVNGTYVWVEAENWPQWEEKMVKGPYIHHISGIYEDVTCALYSASKYIKGLRCDLLDPGEQAIKDYLWARE